MTTLEFSYSLDKASGSLKPFALRLTKDVDDAKDLLQDTILKAFSNKEKFAEGTNLKAWLYTIMRNTFITNYQRAARRGTFVDTTENHFYLNSGKETIENGAFGSFALRDIRIAIDRLDDSHKVPFEMFFRGFKYHEIAEELQIPIGTVKNRIHIARKQLKESLEVYMHKN
ncbi:RNA polymerase sigma factor [Algoriphagus sp. H41]|uniref:RNA polymerase sigma factor n=1 Tax=Algoriphagus oliviformis TaxID=2811231 RepID=A0ABS3BY00_9BACT|nr:RNA polymerase sigma factor [Algoriphagus oliviformis]MBN7809742.1 RNA polymerase sigma factor [Algoriphagus oliviformis]